MTIAEQIAEQIADIKYNSNVLYGEGFSDGEAKGTYYGALAEYDRFWDAFQDKGNKTYYSHAFRFDGWNENNLKPKYLIQPTHAAYMFSGCGYNGDLTKNVNLDFSQCEVVSYCFNNMPKVTRIGKVDTSKAGDLSNVFSFCTVLKKIDLLVLKSNGSQTFTDTFRGCYALEDISFDDYDSITGEKGVIGQNISFYQSTSLTKASITSIVNALSSSTSGKTLTLSKTAVNNAFAEAEWDALEKTKTNWTISLV